MLSLLGLTGTLALFLPFSSDVSPLRALRDAGLAQAALPAFLAPVVSLVSWRAARRGRLRLLAREVAYVLSASMVGLTASVWWGVLWRWEVPNQDAVSVALSAAVLVGCVATLAVNARSRESRRHAPALALQGAYLTHATLCLALLFPRWEIGAYAVLAAAMAFAWQMRLVAGRAPRSVLGADR